MSNQENFLPRYSSVQTPHAGRNKLNCQVDGKERPATPEELVRQRVLHWLIQDKGWEPGKLRLEKTYRWESDPARSHIRPDIELLGDGKDEVLAVVECKHEGVPLSKAVDDQAIEYAVKAKTKHIWVTNGEQHRFLVADEDGGWQAASSIDPLGEEYEPPTGKVEFPDLRDASDVDRYLEEMNLTLNEPTLANARDFTLALYKVIFEVLDEKKRLPYSHDGVHLLDYMGVAFHQFSNRSGGSYYTRYADFIAATRGRVEALSVAVNMWGDEGIRLCVGVTKTERRHHALQLDFEKNCEWNEERRCWDVYHDGSMSQIKRSIVLDAVRESGRGHWIDRYDDGQDWLYLGELPEVQSVKWGNSKKLLANLLHYGLIRTSLREAQKT